MNGRRMSDDYDDDLRIVGNLKIIGNSDERTLSDDVRGSENNWEFL